MMYRRRTKKVRICAFNLCLIAGLFVSFLCRDARIWRIASGETMRIQQSKNYNLADDKFVNLEQDASCQDLDWDNPGELEQ